MTNELLGLTTDYKGLPVVLSSPKIIVDKDFIPNFKFTQLPQSCLSSPRDNALTGTAFSSELCS